jgi:hypothetical protein
MNRNHCLPFQPPITSFFTRLQMIAPPTCTTLAPTNPYNTNPTNGNHTTTIPPPLPPITYPETTPPCSPVHHPIAYPILDYTTPPRPQSQPFPPPLPDTPPSSTHPSSGFLTPSTGNIPNQVLIPASTPQSPILPPSALNLLLRPRSLFQARSHLPPSRLPHLLLCKILSPVINQCSITTTTIEFIINNPTAQNRNSLPQILLTTFHGAPILCYLNHPLLFDSITWTNTVASSPQSALQCTICKQTSWVFAKRNLIPPSTLSATFLLHN